MVDQCQVIIDSKTLQVLTLVVQAYPHNPRIKSIIGKILSNISLHPEFHKAIFQSGWVGLLANWKQHENLLISLPATKALCNLDQEYGGHKYEPGIYLMLPNDRHVQHKNNLSNWGVDVVFIHGLMGGVFYTWRQFDPDNVRESSDAQVGERSALVSLVTEFILLDKRGRLLILLAQGLAPGRLQPREGHRL